MPTAKELFTPIFSVQNIALGLGCLFVLALFDLSSTELASWVQAVGSIAAIAAAIWISSSQRREQINAEKLRTSIQSKTIWTMAARAVRVVRFESRLELNLDSSTSQITGLRISFESINMLELPIASLVEPVCTMKDALRALEAGMLGAQKSGTLKQYVSYRECALWAALITVAADEIKQIISHPKTGVMVCESSQ